MRVPLDAAKRSLDLLYVVACQQLANAGCGVQCFRQADFTGIGENATELIHVGMMVLDNGLTINEFIEQVFNYPTLSEMYKYAAYDGLGNLAGHKLREG